MEADKLQESPPTPTAPKTLPTRPAARAQATGWRKWLYRLLAMTLIPALVLGGVELGLRLFGYGYPTSYFVQSKLDGRTVYVENPQFGRRFFPPGRERSPTPFILPADKPRGTYRIFVLGESAAQGFPDTSYSFARILEVLLRHQYPGVRFEVVNTAMTAINSHVLLPIARECADHQPDLFVVYAGNNEVVGPYGAANVLGPYSSSLGVIRATLFVKSLKTSQLLGAAGRAVTRKGDAPQAWGGMAMYLDSQVRATDPRLEGVYDHFRANLQDICSSGRDAGAQVVVCTVGSNLKDCAPFASLHAPGLTEEQSAVWEKAFAVGTRAEALPHHAEALASYERAAGIDPTYADLKFRRASCLAALGRHDEARASYQEARDLDTLRFRTDSRLNEVVRAVAGGRTAEGIHLVDAEQAFAQASPDGVPGENFFYEHVHMNFSGNYLLARTIYQQLAGILPEAIRARAVAGGPLSEAECAERLALTPWNRWQTAGNVLDLVQKAPFSNQLDQAERQARWRHNVQELHRQVQDTSRDSMLATYRQALRQAEDDTILRGNYAALLQEFGVTDAAVEQWQIVARRSPRDLRAQLSLAELLAQQGKFTEANPHCEAMLRIAPENPHARLAIGRVCSRQGKLDEAIAAYDEALRLNPSFPEAHLARGNALAEQGKTDEAIAAYAEALHIRARFVPAHQALALALVKAGRLDEAARQYHDLLRIEPGNVAAQVNLGVVLARQQKYDEAIAAYTEALRLQPDNDQIQYNLGLALADAGKSEEAVTRLRKVLQARPGLVNARYRLATVLAQQGKVNEAVGEFEQVVRQQPDWTEATEALARLRQQQDKRP
jgi:tetratricopeptide (TPR) repeat protein